MPLTGLIHRIRSHARRTGYRRVAASFKSAGRAHNFHHVPLRLPASGSCVGLLFRLPCAGTRYFGDGRAESSRGALKPFHFGFRQVRLGFKSVGIPPA
nr:putative integron gene cassette protein [uncultured bacterium]